MSVARRNDGRWVVKYKTIDGRWKQSSFRKEEDARQFDREANMASREQDLSLREVMDLYVQNHELSDATIDKFSRLVNGTDRKDGKHTTGPAEHLATKFAHMLTRKDIEGVRQIMRDAGLKPISINYYIGKISAALRWAAEEELISDNPLRNLRPLPVRKERMAVLRMEDFQAIFDLLPDWALWVCKTCVALCLRPGVKELVDLEWDAFDWPSRCVHVFMPKVRAMKTVFPNDSYWGEAWERYQADRELGRRHVVHGLRSERLSYNRFKFVWREAVKQLGIQLRPYDMRHLCASSMLAGGADMAAVAAQLGHRSVNTTAMFYTHLMAGSQRRAGDALPLVQKSSSKE